MPPQQKRAKCHPATAPRARLRPGLAPPQQPHLSPAPRRRPPQEMPPELENEGQHVQTVFPPDDALGGHLILSGKVLLLHNNHTGD